MGLHPEIKSMLDTLYDTGWIDPSELTPQQARQQSDYFSKLTEFPGTINNVQTIDYQIPVDYDQKILARCYYPKKQACSATIVFFHGGGYVLANVDQYDTTCRWICSVIEIPIISIDYRLAPEHPFPVPIEDGYHALCWVADNLTSDQLIVAGDSAGGHLAAMVSILARDKAGPKIAWQWLIYPWIDNNVFRTSYEIFANGFGLSTNAVKWFNKQYLKNNHTTDYPAFPLHFMDYSDLPPTYIIVSENDVLLDEGQCYAETLRSCDNDVHLELAPGMIHGFINLYHIPASFVVTLKIFETMKKLILQSIPIVGN